jgi:hypothetical protein
MTNIIASLLILAAMALAVFSMRGDDFWTEFSPGPAFMPFCVAGLGIFVAGALLWQSLWGPRSARETPDFSDLPKAAAVIVLLCGLLLLLPVLGMLIGSTVLILAILIGLQRRPIAPSLLTAALTALLVYGVFESWLGVDLPRGLAGF